MGIIAKNVGRIVDGTAADIDISSGVARIYEGENFTEVLFEITYPLSIVSSFQGSDYYVALFGHPNWPQASTMALRIKGRPVGALIPIEVLCSGLVVDSQELSRHDEVMEQYAAIAFNKMCKGEVRGFQTVPDIKSSHPPLMLSEFYHQDTVIAIIKIADFFPDNVTCLSDSDKYDDYFNDFLPSFYRKGLFPLPRNLYSENVSVPSKYRSFSGVESDLNVKNVDLKPFSKSLSKGSRAYLVALMQDIDPHETNPFFRFFIYYQAFELWMQDIYIDAINTFKASIDENITTDASSLRDRINILSSELNERSRLSKVLTSNYPKVSGKNVINACNSVLNICGQPPKEALHDAVYSVRNRLIHSFSEAKTAREDFEKLADATLDLICETALHYELPVHDRLEREDMS